MKHIVRVKRLLPLVLVTVVIAQPCNGEIIKCTFMNVLTLFGTLFTLLQNSREVMIVEDFSLQDVSHEKADNIFRKPRRRGLCRPTEGVPLWFYSFLSSTRCKYGR